MNQKITWTKYKNNSIIGSLKIKKISYVAIGNKQFMIEKVLDDLIQCEKNPNTNSTKFNPCISKKWKKLYDSLVQNPKVLIEMYLSSIISFIHLLENPLDILNQPTPPHGYYNHRYKLIKWSKKSSMFCGRILSHNKKISFTSFGYNKDVIANQLFDFFERDSLSTTIDKQSIEHGNLWIPIQYRHLYKSVIQKNPNVFMSVLCHDDDNESTVIFKHMTDKSIDFP